MYTCVHYLLISNENKSEIQQNLAVLSSTNNIEFL